MPPGKDGLQSQHAHAESELTSLCHVIMLPETLHAHVELLLEKAAVTMHAESLCHLHAESLLRQHGQQSLLAKLVAVK